MKYFAQTHRQITSNDLEQVLADMRHLFQVSGSENIKINTAAAGQNQTKNLMSSAHSIEI